MIDKIFPSAAAALGDVADGATVDSHHFDRLYRAGKIILELVPQGNLAERVAQRVPALAVSSRPRRPGIALVIERG